MILPPTQCGQIYVNIPRQIPLYPKPIIRFGELGAPATGTDSRLYVRVGESFVIEPSAGIFVLKLDIVAAGTLLRVGSGISEFCPVEQLTIGDELYDPVEERLVEITEIACVTLDNDTIRDRGFSPKLMAGESGASPLIYGVKVPVVLARNGYTPPIRGEHSLEEGTVFFALGFERRAIVETPAALCEFVRPSAYAFESSPRRSPTVLGADTLSSLR